MVMRVYLKEADAKDGDDGIWKKIIQVMVMKVYLKEADTGDGDEGLPEGRRYRGGRAKEECLTQII